MYHYAKKGKIFLIGIGGIGMSGLAEMLHNSGYVVFGSDLNEGSNVKRLRELGINIKIGHKASNIIGASLIVYSSAINKNNPEIIRAIKNKVPLVGRAEMLAELMRMKKTITVAGSHGKTTTVSLISEIFVTSGLDPTVVNGGIINSLGSNTRFGNSSWMIVETDESDGSFIKMPSFCGLITSIDDEHVDFYSGMKHLEDAFKDYINNISIFGLSVICSDDQRAFHLACQNKRSDHIFYGTSTKANYRAKNIRVSQQGQIFDIDIKIKNKKMITFKNVIFSMHGKHNLLNALGAIALSHNLGVNFKFIKKALKNFKGVRRRMTLINKHMNRRYFDDYAHHPTEIRASLRALKALSKKRLITVIQPHRFSRVKSTYNKFSKSFIDSDIVIVLPIFAAGEKKIRGINASNLAKIIKKNSQTKTIYLDQFEKVENFLNNEMKKGETVVFMGAGNISRSAYNYVNSLSNNNV